MTLDVRWEQIEERRPLLDLLPAETDEQRFAFVTSDADGDRGVVGWGVAARIDVGVGRSRFSRARQELARAAGPPDALAFASFSFDEAEDSSVMVVPRVAITREAGLTRRMSVGPLTPADAPSTSHRFPRSRDRVRYGGSTVNDSEWIEAVGEALESIRTGVLEKVVLARDVHLWSRDPFRIDQILHDLRHEFPTCFVFVVDRLIGASPELLLERRGASVRSRALAGTARRDPNPALDAELGRALMGSKKDRHEHELARDSVITALQPHCSRLDAPDSPSILRLENVQHLATEVSGELRAGPESTPPHVLDLLADLHPTAALGGRPRQEALDAIRELEGMPRGRYGGPVGWCNNAGDGEFAIAIRCAEVAEARARLFAGAGIVAGSLPESELNETWLKLRAMMRVLER